MSNSKQPLSNEAVDEFTRDLRRISEASGVGLDLALRLMLATITGLQEGLVHATNASRATSLSPAANVLRTADTRAEAAPLDPVCHDLPCNPFHPDSYSYIFRYGAHLFISHYS